MLHFEYKQWNDPGKRFTSIACLLTDKMYKYVNGNTEISTFNFAHYSPIKNWLIFEISISISIKMCID